MLKRYIFFWAVMLNIGFALSQPSTIGQKYYTRGYLPISSGGFTYNQPFIGGFNSPMFQKMDINNDGIVDLVCFDKNDSKILPFLRDKDSFYTYAPQYEAYFPSGSFYYITADLNSDGKFDIFTLDQSSSLIIHKNITGPNDSFTRFANLGPQYYRNQYVPPFPILYNGLALSRTDLPSITDVDGDGDLDIVTYDATYTIYVMYSDVRSDFSWDKDTFEFQKMDVCFGYFNDFNNSVNLGVCPYQEKLKPRHTGGASLLMYDNNEDGDLEMIISNVGVKPMYFIENGKSDFSLKYDSMIAWDSIYPTKTKRAASYYFPSGFLFDVDGDGVNDLLTSPTAFSDVKETDQMWYYRNFGKNNKPDFRFVRSNFLTDKNIDLGAKSAPSFMDIDADGDMDMFVASNGDFEITGGNKDRIYYYENTGTSKKPAFNLKSTDWLGLSNQSLADVILKFGDVDGDKDWDLLVGERRGRVRWYENTAGTGNPAAFQLRDTNLVNSTMASGESNAAACVFNYNNDTLPDLLVGYYNGLVHLYVNNGTVGQPNYTRAPGTAWGMRANEWYRNDDDSGFVFYGNAVPDVIDFDNDGTYEVLVGTAFGTPRLYHVAGRSVYDSLIADKRWLWQFSVSDSIVPDFGGLIVPANADLDGDSFPEIVFGNSRGGLILATTKTSTASTGIHKPVSRELHFNMFPNPANNELWIDRKEYQTAMRVTLVDVSGREVLNATLPKGDPTIRLDVSNVTQGIYWVQITGENTKGVQKVLIQRN